MSIGYSRTTSGSSPLARSDGRGAGGEGGQWTYQPQPSYPATSSVNRLPQLGHSVSIRLFPRSLTRM